MQPIRTLEQARRAARRGAIDGAIPALRRFADLGHDGACPSLAELFAYLGLWADAIPYAERLISHPSAVYAGNIFDDMIRILGRAGHEVGTWERIAQAAEHAIHHIDQQVPQAHLRHRYVTILENLHQYATRHGSAPHELIALFIPATQQPVPADMQHAQYHDAVANVFTYRPELRQRPDQLAVHLFALAQSFNQPDDALVLYEQHHPLIQFEGAVYSARVLAGRGQPDAAWSVLAAKVSSWWPCDTAQVAPVELILDPVLHHIMTPERCEFVLQTPRGPEAAP